MSTMQFAYILLPVIFPGTSDTPEPDEIESDEEFPEYTPPINYEYNHRIYINEPKLMEAFITSIWECLGSEHFNDRSAISLTVAISNGINIAARMYSTHHFVDKAYGLSQDKVSPYKSAQKELYKMGWRYSFFIDRLKAFEDIEELSSYVDCMMYCRNYVAKNIMYAANEMATSQRIPFLKKVEDKINSYSDEVKEDIYRYIEFVPTGIEYDEDRDSIDMPPTNF